MKKILALALALALCLTACAALADGIKVATIGPLTGPYANYGKPVEDSLILAAEQANAQGGLQFEVLPAQDDQGDGEKALNAYNKLKDDGLQVLLGTVTSGACAAVAGSAVGERYFMLTPSASADMVPEVGDNVFQICFTDSSQGAKAAEYIKSHELGTKVGIIYNNAQDYSAGIKAAFEAKAAEIGLEIVAAAAFSDDNAPDFSAQVNEVKQAGADLVFLPIYYTPEYKILTYASSIEYAPVFYGVDGTDGILEQENVDASILEGLMYLTPYTPNSTDERTKAYTDAFFAKFGYNPNQFGADEYDALFALKALCEKAGVTAETSPADACELLIAAITSEDFSYDGITGTMSWSADGTVTKEPKAAVIQNGAYVMVE